MHGENVSAIVGIKASKHGEMGQEWGGRILFVLLYREMKECGKSTCCRFLV